MEGGATDVPTPGEVLRALRQLLIGNPHLRNHPLEEVSQALLVSGYLQKKPDSIAVREALRKVDHEGIGTEDEGRAEGERHELEAAGWEPIERQGKVAWRDPKRGRLYTQGAAINALHKGRIGD